MADYLKALELAEKREREVKTSFERHDVDGNGMIELVEVLPLLDQLGMVQQLKSPKVDFLSNMFLQYGMSKDSSEMLGFEEFKDFYNAAKDDAAGRRPRKPPKGLHGPEAEARHRAPRAPNFGASISAMPPRRRERERLRRRRSASGRRTSR
jgi:hypothetical protein